MKIKLKTGIQFNTPVEKMTGKEVKVILNDNTLKNMVEYMSKNKIPYLHARQIGLELNFFVWQYQNKWQFVVNPKMVALKKKTKILSTIELSYTERTKKGTAKVYTTKRAYKITASYDDFKNEVTYKRKPLKLKAHEASVWQQMCDISNGLNITRFKE